MSREKTEADVVDEEAMRQDTDDLVMPSRLETLHRTAKRLLPNAQDWDMLCGGLIGIGAGLGAVGVVLFRLVLLLALPLSALLLYPMMRTNHRRHFEDFRDEKRRRAALVADLTRQCQHPIEWPHDWGKLIPSDDLRRAADEQDQASARSEQ